MFDVALDSAILAAKARLSMHQQFLQEQRTALRNTRMAETLVRSAQERLDELEARRGNSPATEGR